MSNMAKQKMNIIGIGPFVIGFIGILTAIGLYLNFNGYLNSGLIYESLTFSIKSIAILLIVGSVYMYLNTLIKNQIIKNIKENKLVKDGMFRLVRHPIYSSLTGIFIGILLLFPNLWFIIWIIIFYIILKISTPIEEKILEKEFKEEYFEYKKEVNQIIPWFKKI